MQRRSILLHVGLFCLLVFLFILYKVHFTNLVLLMGDENTYNVVALDTIKHETIRFVDPSEFPGIRFTGPQRTMLITLISLATGLSPFFLIKSFLPVFWFFLGSGVIYLFTHRLTQRAALSLFVSSIFMIGAMKTGTYNLSSWFSLTIPQNFSYIYFLILNYFIFGTDFLKKNISLYDVLIVVLLFLWRETHSSYILFGFAYYLLALLARNHFGYIRIAACVLRRQKWLWAPIVILLGLGVWAFASRLLMILNEVSTLDGGRFITWDYVRRTVGLIFILVWAVTTVLFSRRALSKNDSHARFPFYFLASLLFFGLMIIYPFVLSSVLPLSFVYYRMLGFFIGFLYVAVILFTAAYFATRPKTVMAVLSLLLLSNIPSLQPFDVWAYLDDSLLVTENEQVLLEVLDTLPENSVFINSSVNGAVFLSQGYSTLSLPCFLDYLYNPDFESYEDALESWTEDRIEIHSNENEVAFYETIVSQVEACYRYNLEDESSSTDIYQLFDTQTTDFQDIPYHFFYVQSHERAFDDYLAHYKSMHAPSEQDLLYYTFYPKIRGIYFEPWYETDAFTLWEVRKDISF